MKKKNKHEHLTVPMFGSNRREIGRRVKVVNWVNFIIELCIEFIKVLLHAFNSEQPLDPVFKIEVESCSLRLCAEASYLQGKQRKENKEKEKSEKQTLHFFLLFQRKTKKRKK